MKGRRVQAGVLGVAGVLAAGGIAACASRTETRSNVDTQEYSTNVTLVANRAEVLLEQGRQQAARGNFEQAMTLYESALSSGAAEPKHRAQALLSLGQAWGSPLNLKRDSHKAMQYYQRVVAEYPDTPQRAEAEQALGALRVPTGE